MAMKAMLVIEVKQSHDSRSLIPAAAITHKHRIGGACGIATSKMQRQRRAEPPQAMTSFAVKHQPSSRIRHLDMRRNLLRRFRPTHYALRP
ncbi:MAG: hypothetical protein HC938_15560 [Nitrospira sp.]|nr:hypothetical protein [Nitrospira sp.]